MQKWSVEFKNLYYFDLIFLTDLVAWNEIRKTNEFNKVQNNFEQVIMFEKKSHRKTVQHYCFDYIMKNLILN